MFMSNPGKGGRGKAAPYSTVHYRIPEPIKPTVERLAAAYRIMVADRGMLKAHIQLVESVDNVISQSTGLEMNSTSKVEILQDRINQLEGERERAISILVPALEASRTNNASKLIRDVKSIFPELENVKTKDDTKRAQSK